MKTLKEEHRLVLKQYRQLKIKSEKDVAAGFSQGAISDSFEIDPGVRICIYYCIMLYLCNVKNDTQILKKSCCILIIECSELFSRSIGWYLPS